MLATPPSNPDIPLVGVITAIAAIIGGSLLLGRWLDGKRIQGYADWCLGRALQFQRESPGEEQRHVMSCPLFRDGHGQRWRFSISGRLHDVPYTMFEYQWVTGYGRNARRHIISCVLWTTQRELPAFMLTPEGFLDKIGVMFGGQDIDFSEGPEFSKAYRLRGGDESAVRALFDARLRGSFSEGSSEHVSGCGRELIWWRPGRLPTPDGLDGLLAYSDRIRRVFDSDEVR